MSELDRYSELESAVIRFLTSRSPQSEDALKCLVGLDASVTFYSIENSDPVGDMLREQGLCPVCECPLNVDGNCENCEGAE